MPKPVYQRLKASGYTTDRGRNDSASSRSFITVSWTWVFITDLKHCVSYLLLMQTCTQKMLHLIVHNFRNRRESPMMQLMCATIINMWYLKWENTKLSWSLQRSYVTKKKFMENQRKLKKLRMMKIQIVRTTQMFFHLLRQLQIINKCWHWNLYQKQLCHSCTRT